MAYIVHSGFNLGVCSGARRLVICALESLIIAAVFVGSSWAAVPAFPGAQGGGASSAGGRGGAVIEVINLNDSGPGSLRACIEASGQRTCVFRVAGVIHFVNRMNFVAPYITVAGQTAPGGGITLQGDLGNFYAFWVTTHDVTIRYITCSIGMGPNHTPGPTTGVGCVGIPGSANEFNLMFDHLSMRWWDDKGFVGTGSTTSTLQWSMMYEPNQAHPVDYMMDNNAGHANLLTDNDAHHNLLANSGHRLPLFNIKSGRWVSNIIYCYLANPYALLTQGGTNYDVINNLYNAGPANSAPNNACGGSDVHEILFNLQEGGDLISGELPGPPANFLLGNVGPHNANYTTAPNDTGQQAMTRQGDETGDKGSLVPLSWYRSAPLPVEPYPITADAPGSLDTVILPTVGNSQRLDCLGNWVLRRDSVDTRVVNQYIARGTGLEFAYDDAAHTTPPVDPGTACPETLHDGIPDAWKVAMGLSTTDRTLYTSIDPHNGYTYLESYLNGTAAVLPPPPPPPPPPVISGTYEAEAAVMGPGVRVFSCPQCSGVAEVGDIGTLTFPAVTVPAAGSYVISIWYLNGSTLPRPGYLSINGGPKLRVTFPVTGDWLQPKAEGITVTLKAGVNVLVWTSPSTSTYMADLDKIQVHAK